MRHPALDANPGRLVARTARAYRNELARRFAAAELPVTAEQWPVLVHVQAAPGLTQAQLTARLLREKSMVSRLVAALQARGLLSRTPDPADARLRRLRLTEAGEALMDPLWREAVAVLELSVAGVDEADLVAMRRALGRIFANLHPEQDP